MKIWIGNRAGMRVRDISAEIRGLQPRGSKIFSREKIWKSGSSVRFTVYFCRVKLFLLLSLSFQSLWNSVDWIVIIQIPTSSRLNHIERMIRKLIVRSSLILCGSLCDSRKWSTSILKSSCTVYFSTRQGDGNPESSLAPSRASLHCSVWSRDGYSRGESTTFGSDLFMRITIPWSPGAVSEQSFPPMP
jgi:hypothetical protein